jgi:hypothetical protein
MAKFRKLPVEIEAILFDFAPATADAIVEMAGPDSDRVLTFDENGVHIETLEGTMTGNLGDYIIKGVKGELYPCKPDVFMATYEASNKIHKIPDLTDRADLLSQTKDLMEQLHRMSPYTYLLITSTDARVVQEEMNATHPTYDN